MEDPELPFPESVAASQIHKAGQVGAQAAKYLFYNMAFGAIVFLAGAFSLFSTDKDWLFAVGQIGASALRLGPLGTQNALKTGGFTMFSGPTVSPAYIGVGYVIGPTAGIAEFLGNRHRLGTSHSASDVFHRTAVAPFMPANRR